MKKHILSYIICIIALTTGTVLTGCKEKYDTISPYSDVLIIYDFSPVEGKAGTQVLINGEHFSTNKEDISVDINGITLPVLNSNVEQILAQVPDNEAIGKGKINIKVNGETTSSEVDFTYLSVNIKNFSPTYGKAGSTVGLSIDNMPDVIDSYSVSINGVESEECTITSNGISFVIPEVEPGIYPIVVTLNGKTYSIEGFEYKEVVFERKVTTLAGNTEWGFVDGIGTNARFKFTGWIDCRGGICVDNDGNIFVTDMWNCAVRKISPDGKVETFAKTISPDGPDDQTVVDWGANWRLENDGNGTKNVWLWAYGIDIDADNNLYVVNHNSAHVVRYDPQGYGYYMGWISGISCAVDKTHKRLYIMNPNGDIYLKDDLNDYGASPVNATGVKIISNGACGGMVVDEKTGDLYVTNVQSNLIKRYKFDNWSNNEIIAGSGAKGHKDGNADEASFDQPWGLAFAPDGNLLVAGAGSAKPASDGSYTDSSIRYIDLVNRKVTTFAGGEKGSEDATYTLNNYSGVDSSTAPLPASFDAPSAICVDKNGIVYVLDRMNNCVKKIETIEK